MYSRAHWVVRGDIWCECTASPSTPQYHHTAGGVRGYTATHARRSKSLLGPGGGRSFSSDPRPTAFPANRRTNARRTLMPLLCHTMPYNLSILHSLPLAIRENTRRCHSISQRITPSLISAYRERAHGLAHGQFPTLRWPVRSCRRGSQLEGRRAQTRPELVRGRAELRHTKIYIHTPPPARPPTTPNTPRRQPPQNTKERRPRYPR